MKRPFSRPEGLLHAAFETTLALKALEAVTELLAGIGLYLVPGGGIGRFTGWLTRAELAEDPKDWVANTLLTMAQKLSIETTHFYAAYMASHGVLKLVLVLLLWRQVRWAYPASVVMFMGFIAYQIHRYVLTHAPMMIVLTLLDLVIIWLTLREYRRLRGRNGD
ncbi:DUF2127 domain-containing protein [Thalassovita mangrovi]|uniref:DUF2127 domain-containing protein n=1 Tax=Thalassovita mangrovi TaxID=2692236 RepID=A0A6L8LLP6_9RHOB|nr:DUF2127 domain-containing protein [Thalassovita mangrovi]MYM54029.1 DUF2127 domain-containing protein [Thalassovita mangrovi]